MCIRDRLSVSKIQKIALVGGGDLAEIAQLVSSHLGFEVAVLNSLPDVDSFEAYIITDVINPQSAYDKLLLQVPYHKIITPSLLHISRGAQ